jgi:2-polyprenyl-6-methoxyphenol hydroxylase-like FAD-dependent oxidoreductase
MEQLRRWGLSERLRAHVPVPVSWSQDVVFCTSMAGWQLSRFTDVLGLTLDGDRFPEPGQVAPQYALEELLRSVVDELPTCRLVTGARVTALEQDDSEVRVTVADSSGATTTVTADYVLGCDGPRSVVREAIGASYQGEHALRPNFGMVFDAPALAEVTRHGPAVIYWTVNPASPAILGPLDLSGKWWIIALGVDEETGLRNGREIIDNAIGVPVEVSILSHDSWIARMQLVDRIRSGRVFLAGDAAHLNPPFGGYGLNTGFGDAVDLGWKIAAVLDGWADPGLLDSYGIERLPIHRQVIDEATTNMQVLSAELLADSLEDQGSEGERARAQADARIQQAKRREFHSLDFLLGLGYAGSPFVVPDQRGASLPSEEKPDSAAWPGGRLPHVWLEPGHSLYDALGSGMTLVVAAGDVVAAESLTAAAAARGVPLRVLDLREHGLRERFGAGLVLVRPDQHVAWCGDETPADPGALLDRIRGCHAAAVPAPVLSEGVAR